MNFKEDGASVLQSSSQPSPCGPRVARRGAPLRNLYPGPDAHTVNEAITDASLDAKFESAPVTQYETATFRATVIYGTSSPNPDLPTVKVAWSNEAALAAQAEGTFDIGPTSASRQFLDAGTRRPNGGYELTWT